MCTRPTSRHLERSTVLPAAAASASITSQCSASASKPAAEVAPMDRSPMPCRPASLGPAGEATAAAQTSKFE